MKSFVANRPLPLLLPLFVMVWRLIYLCFLPSTTTTIAPTYVVSSWTLVQQQQQQQYSNKKTHDDIYSTTGSTSSFCGDRTNRSRPYSSSSRSFRSTNNAIEYDTIDPSSSSSQSFKSSSSSINLGRRDAVGSLLVQIAGSIATIDTISSSSSSSSSSQQQLPIISHLVANANANAAVVANTVDDENENKNRISPNKSESNENTMTVLKTSSGLKYIEIVPGTGISPSYGNLCSVSYTAYVKLPTSSKSQSSTSNKPQKYDHCDGYLIKHGNGRMISGLDEGLHTMKVGGTRRMLIPPKLGFVDIGLGPVPDQPWNRYRLNTLLDQMVELSGGTVIYEVTLLSVIPDEADVGYYTDASLSPEDFATLQNNIQTSGRAGRMKEQVDETAANTIKGQDRLL